MSARDRFSSQAIRFLICGGTAAAVNWLARIALSPFLPFGSSVVVAYAIGMAVGFVLYRTVVWTESRQPLMGQAFRFAAVNAYSAVVVFLTALGANALGGLMSNDAALVEALAHGFAIAVGAVANYLGHSRFTFARPNTAASSPRFRAG